MAFTRQEANAEKEEELVALLYPHRSLTHKEIVRELGPPDHINASGASKYWSNVLQRMKERGEIEAVSMPGNVMLYKLARTEPGLQEEPEQDDQEQAQESPASYVQLDDDEKEDAADLDEMDIPQFLKHTEDAVPAKGFVPATETPGRSAYKYIRLLREPLLSDLVALRKGDDEDLDLLLDSLDIADKLLTRIFEGADQ